MAPTSSPFDVSPNETDRERSSADDDRPPNPFVTTSDVMNQLNKHLSELSSGGCPSSHGAGNSKLLRHQPQPQQQPRFELQKRLPDGSTVPATPDEIAAADFQAKLDQSAKFVSQLATSEDRQAWAEQQRQMGNAYFGRGDYKAAMDVYLTCLVVRESAATDFVRRTLVPILNNLAQCTLQLGMHGKTVLFCEMALEEIRNIQHGNRGVENEGKTRDEVGHSRMEDEMCQVDPIAVCKIYFKLAKAQRLSGNYREARQALNSSLDRLEQRMDEIDASSRISMDMSCSSLKPYQEAIQKEFRHLDVAEREGRKNHQRQKRAMQQMLSPAGAETDSTSSVISNIKAAGSLYGTLTPSSPRTGPRKFSTLRARKPPPLSQHSPRSVTSSASSASKRRGRSRPTTDDAPSLLSTYSQYYWWMVVRVTTFLLAILGDEEHDKDGEGWEAGQADKRDEDDKSNAKSRH
jgi:tetratricopeptide (TPR) repeat protein